jgi:hypothetical protein
MPLTLEKCNSWLSCDFWNIEEAAALSQGIDPDDQDDSRNIQAENEEDLIYLTAQSLYEVHGFDIPVWQAPSAWISLLLKANIRICSVLMTANSHRLNPDIVNIESNNGVTTNKLRRNYLDPVIERATRQAKSLELADVYDKLKQLALQEEHPFTGAFNGDALAYTSDRNDSVSYLTKDALRKRLARRQK